MLAPLFTWGCDQVLIAVQLLFGWLIGCMCAIPITAVLAVRFVLHPIRFFARKARPYPAVLANPALGTHGYVLGNGQVCVPVVPFCILWLACWRADARRHRLVLSSVSRVGVVID